MLVSNSAAAAIARTAIVSGESHGTPARACNAPSDSRSPDPMASYRATMPTER